MSSVYTFPEIEILLGGVLERVADPPESQKIKSDASISPLPLFVL